jgi:hypothetical protein
MHPVYVKDGQEQIAPTPRDEVRLRFAGWRLKNSEPPAEPAADSSETPAESSSSRRPRRGSKSTD